MKFIKNMRLRTRILVAFILPVILFAGKNIYDTVSFAEREHRLAKAELVSLMDIARSTVDDKLALFKSGKLKKEEAIAQLQHVIQKFRYGDGNYFFALDAADTTFVIHPKASLLGQQPPIAEFFPFVRSVRSNQSDFITYLWDGDNKVSYAIYIPELNWVLGTGQSLAGIESEIVTAYRDLFIEIGAVLVIFIFFSILLTRTITEPFGDITELMTSVAKGDLSKQLQELDKSELGDLGHVINDAIVKFAEMVNRINEAAGSIENNSTNLSVITQQAANSLSGQQDELVQVSTAITEMVASIQDVASNVSDAAKAAKDADLHALDGSTNIEATFTKMVELAEHIQVAVTAMDELAKDTEQISTITESIENVSDQTNLLALNAAIEAARAGSAGRGFAVVADEVRGLSKRTSENTEEIRTVIETLQNKARHVVSIMNTSSTLFQEARDLTEQSKLSVETITRSIGHIENMTAQIASATEQQSVVSGEINQNVAAVSDAASETADGSRAISESASELNTLAQNLDTLAKNFKL